MRSCQAPPFRKFGWRLNLPFPPPPPAPLQKGGCPLRNFDLTYKFNHLNLLRTYTAWKVSVFRVFLLHIQSKCRKRRTKRTPNTDNFHAVLFITKLFTCVYGLKWTKKLWKIQKRKKRCHSLNFTTWLNYFDYFDSTTFIDFDQIWNAWQLCSIKYNNY